MRITDPNLLNAKRRLAVADMKKEHLIENVTLPSGLHRAHVTNPCSDPQIEDWEHLIPENAHTKGIWGYTDSQGMHHLVMTWKEELK